MTTSKNWTPTAETFGVPEEWARERRLEYLEGQRRWLSGVVSLYTKVWQELKNETDSRLFIGACLLDWKADLHKITRQMRVIQSKPDGQLTEDQIAAARDKPLESLTEHRRGMAVCPFHDDHKPSMDIRNGYYYCYVCGATGDAIDYVMKTRSMTFKEAVTWLTS